MPELAEVEFYRRQWDAGLGQRVLRVHLHGEKRIFRSTSVQDLEQALPGSVLLGSEARGKRLLFRFSKNLWLGLHLGMTGKLLVAHRDFQPGKHDHLVLFQKKQTLVFNDFRLFGRVEFTQSPSPPSWWSKLPVSVNSPEFRAPEMKAFLRRHPKLAIKGSLLLQSGFPGIGNWMADEILWRAGIAPGRRTEKLTAEQEEALWKALRFVCRGAMKHISPAFADPPQGWLFHERWSRNGRCPVHGTPLRKGVVAGRTTAWCPRCQK